MADEENVVETVEKKKESVNIWKVLLISLMSIGLSVFFCISIYNSDWFINQTIPFKKTNDIELGKNTTWNYKCKYEENRLKIQITINNIDEKMMKVADKILDENDYLIKLVFVDKDGFKLTELKIPKKDFVHIADEKGMYTIRTFIVIDKNTIRKLKDIDVEYKPIIDSKYDDMVKEIGTQYKNVIDNILGF